MEVSGVKRKTTCSASCPGIDAEELLIIQKLLAYGVTPTGDKSADREKLHQIEINKAKQLNYVSNEFLTVSSAEQEKIQERKKERRKEIYPEEKKEYRENFTGANALGEQIYLAVNMKSKPQAVNKYQSSDSIMRRNL